MSMIGNRFGRAKRTCGLVAAMILFAPVNAELARAEELPTFTLELNDGVLMPERIVIPANKTVKLVLKNTGSSAAEFESLDLRREKVLAPGTVSFVVLRKVSPGTYDFYDEFHIDTARGVIVAE